MKSVALDSLPTIPIKIPSDVSFNVSPAYQGKRRRGQPILGQQQVKYTHFVPMGDASPHIKKLLEISESNMTPLKPFDGYNEILKAEKETSNVEKPVVDKKVFHSDFKTDAKAYLNTPNHDRHDSYTPNEGEVPLVAKNNANLANIIAAARPIKTKAKVKPGPKPNPKAKKSTPTNKAKKMTPFRIVKKGSR